MARKPSALLIVLGLLSVLSAQAPGSVEILDIEPFWYVCMDFSGSIEMALIERFIQEAREQGLASKVRGDLFRIMYDFAGLGQERQEKWGLGFRIDEALDLGPPLFVRRYGFSRVAKGYHRGPYETAFSSMNEVLNRIEQKNLLVAGPPIEVWIGDPARDKPEDLRTEFIVPVKPKDIWGREPAGGGAGGGPR